MAQSNSQVNLDLEDEDMENTPRRNIFHRLDSNQTRAAPPNRSNLGLGDRLNNVFREIRPLVENARMGNNARLSLPTWLPRNPAATHQSGENILQRQHSANAHVNLGPNSQTYVVTEVGASAVHRQQSAPNDITRSLPIDSNLSDQIPEHVEVNINDSVPNNNLNDNADNESQSDDGSQQVVDVRATLNLLIRYAPFYLILFIKYLYDCREGIFTFLILFCSFSHSNSLVRREHGKQMNRSISSLLSELLFTLCCIFVVHVLFGHGVLLLNVIAIYRAPELIDVWYLIWMVVLTDLLVKIFTVDFKIIVTMMPAFILPYQRRGKVYLLVEATSQLYRSLLTIQPWLYYLLRSYEGAEKMLGILLVCIYVLAKFVEVVVLRLRLLKIAVCAVQQSVSLGTKPTAEEMVSAGDSCAICHDDFTTPVKMDCSHIFCELCISAWLDREHTCPLCRAIVAEEPTWRDGSTTYDFQLY